MSGNNSNVYTGMALQLDGQQKLANGNIAGLYEIQAGNSLSHGDTQSAQTQIQMAQMMNMLDQQHRQEEAEEADRIERKRLERIEEERQAELRRQEMERQRQIVSAQRAQAYADHMQQGDNFAQANHYAQAIQQYDQALNYKNNDITARYNIAWCHKKDSNFIEAYKQLSALTGHAHEIPNFSSHISECAAILEQSGVNYLQQAMNFYNSGATKQANEALAQAKQNITHTPEGKNLQQGIETLQMQMQWDAKRTHVNAAFQDADSLLEKHFYQKALDSLNACHDAYSKYASYLHKEDQDNSAQLSSLLQIANRGVEKQQNIQNQNTVNAELAQVKQNLAKHNISAAITNLNQAVLAADRITNINDITSNTYVNPEKIRQAITTLNKLQTAYNNRAMQQPRELSQQILNTIKLDQRKLGKDDTEALSTTIENIFKNKWSSLDSRELTKITDALPGIIEAQLKETGACFRCFSATTHYIEDLQNMRTTIEKCITDNLPEDTRAPIKLELFADNTYLEGAGVGPLRFSTPSAATLMLAEAVEIDEPGAGIVQASAPPKPEFI